MNPEQEKVRCLLVDTITLLCRNGLTYTSDIKVQGLLAITIDSKEFFVIQIDETLAENLDDNDGDNAIDCADQPAVVDELDELSSQPMTMPSMMRKAEVENSNQSRPFGRKRVRRIVSDEMNDKKSFCPQSLQPDFLAGNYPDRFVNSLSSVSAQVKVEDDDLLLLDSSGHSVIGQNYDYGNSGGDFQPSRNDFCDGLTGATGAGLSSRSGPHQVKSRQKRKRSSGGQQWNSYEGVEWTGQGDVVSSLATNYDLDEMEEKPNQHESQQDMTDFPYGKVYNLETGDEYSSEASGSAMMHTCQYKDCDKTFNYKQNLVRHQRQVHGCIYGAESEVTYFCRIDGCSSTFRSEAALSRHRNKVHGQP